MQFRDIKPGYPVFILDKESVTATQGKAVSVGVPRIQTPNTFGQTSSLVVDIAIEADGTTKTYTIPETAAVTYAGTLALSTDKGRHTPRDTRTEVRSHGSTRQSGRAESGS